jgi:clan AA aspartic protease (TIGR02281 family)
MSSIKSMGLGMNRALLLILVLVALASPAGAEMYRWVDEKGTVHFTDDLSTIPEKYRPDAETRKGPRETTSPGARGKSLTFPPSQPPPKTSEAQGFEVPLSRRNQIMFVEVLLNGRVKRNFIVDSGASYVLIDRGTARELGLTIDGYTPFIPVTTVSEVILTPLVTLKSVQVGGAEVENVEALIYTMPAGKDGLLGNSFLGRFRMVLDSVSTKMTLYSVQGVPSPDRPGGYASDYWVGRFRFLHYNLEMLKKLKASYERKDARTELNRVNNAIRYFENQLSEWERKASLAGVPHQWRE